jgi:hypothetical protein
LATTASLKDAENQIKDYVRREQEWLYEKSDLERQLYQSIERYEHELKRCKVLRSQVTKLKDADYEQRTRMSVFADRVREMEMESDNLREKIHRYTMEKASQVEECWNSHVVEIMRLRQHNKLLSSQLAVSIQSAGHRSSSPISLGRPREKILPQPQVHTYARVSEHDTDDLKHNATPSETETQSLPDDHCNAAADPSSEYQQALYALATRPTGDPLTAGVRLPSPYNYDYMRTLDQDRISHTRNVLP